MKKIALIAALALLCVCCLAAVGCGKTEVATNSDPASQTSSETENKSEVPSQAGAESSETSDSDDTGVDSSDDDDENSFGEDFSFDMPDLDGGIFWLTSFGDGSQEGGGVIFTDTDRGGQWWLHIAFKPVEIEGITCYEVTDIVNGISDGSASALSVPEGGFVYALHPGNNYPKLAAEDPDNPNLQGKPNYMTETCTELIKKAATWKVGDMIIVPDLDLSSTEVPTETPDLQYYEEGYICPLIYLYMGQ